MSDRVPKIRATEKPTFDAATFSDRLQEGRTMPAPRPPAAVFDPAKPSSIVGMARYVVSKLTDTVNALTEFTAAHETKLIAHTERLNAQDARLDAVEAARPPFASGSG
jgi:hypothetical protein